MHLIHLNLNSLLSKTDGLRSIGKLTNAVIGLSETQLDSTVLNDELEMEGYDLVRSRQFS